jgi:arylsulfatase A-like enzyme
MNNRTTDVTNRKPNVIVFFTDQQRWDTTGVHGNPLGLTPNFDRVAGEGAHHRDRNVKTILSIQSIQPRG